MSGDDWLDLVALVMAGLAIVVGALKLAGVL